MSSYSKLTKHPKTGKWENAQWLDDYFGRHLYGVAFADGLVFDPEEVKLETKESPQPLSTEYLNDFREKNLPDLDLDAEVVKNGELPHQPTEGLRHQVKETDSCYVCTVCGKAADTTENMTDECSGVMRITPTEKEGEETIKIELQKDGLVSITSLFDLLLKKGVIERWEALENGDFNIYHSSIHSKEIEIRESIAKEVKEKGLHLGYKNSILEIIKGDKEIR